MVLKITEYSEKSSMVLKLKIWDHLFFFVSKGFHFSFFAHPKVFLHFLFTLKDSFSSFFGRTKGLFHFLLVPKESGKENAPGRTSLPSTSARYTSRLWRATLHGFG